MITPEETAELERLLAKASPAPWDSDTFESEGSYGSGEDVHEGFTVRQMRGADGNVLFDSLNSEAAVVHVEYGDEEASGCAWDETAERDFALIVFLRNYAAALLAAARQAEAKDARIAELEAALRPFSEDVLGEDDEDFSDETPVILKFGRATVYTPVVMGDLRRAARLADPSPNAGGGGA